MTSDTEPRAHVRPEEGESWLFISYSRTTSDMAQALTDALESRGYRVWIDQDSITPASDWRARISVGIEGARAVVLIISQRFIESPNCDRELVEAAGLGKRLIPVLAEEIVIERLPKPVPDLDLIMAVDGDIVRVTEEIVEAVETDLQWLDEHTRLLQASIRWAETPDDRSLLLRGRDLREMEALVAAAADRRPFLTQGQRSFLAACDDNRRRTRTLSWAGAVVAAVIVTLAVIASVQRAAAVQARTGAEAQRIAADAASLYPTQLDLGLRLALAARSYDPSPATESALLRGLTFGPGLRATTVVAANGLDHAVFSEGGRSIVLVDDDGAASTWSESGSVTVGPSGVIAVAEGGGRAVYVTADAVLLPGVACPSPGRVLAAGIAPTGAILAVAEGEGSTVVALDSSCGIRTVARLGDRVSTLAESSSGRAAWGTRRGQVTVIDSDGNQVDSARYDGAGVSSLAFGPDDVLAVGLDNGAVAVLGGIETDRAHRGAVTAITFTAEGMVSAGADGWIRVWDEGRPVVELTDVGANGQPSSILDIAQWASGSLVSIDASGRAQGWDLAGKSPLVDLVEPTTGIRQIATLGGAWVAVGSNPAASAGVDLPDSEVTAVGRNGDAFVFGDATGGVWRSVDGAWQRVQGPSDLPVRFVSGGWWADSAAVYSRDGRWDVVARALAAAGDTAYVATADSKVLRLSEAGAELAFEGHRGTVDALAISPDTRLVASGGDDRLVYVWDRETGRVEHTLVGHTDRVLDIAFSPDGSRLVSVGEDDRMIEWDLTGNSMVGGPIAHPRSVRIVAVAWSSDGSLLTGGPGVFRWTLRADDLVSAACRLANPRQLTDAERQQYLDRVEAADPC